ncbi:hypothetical protein ACUXAV_000424 [Cupriavidus metallidurans]|uniref:hypothetical protein n=1 Tax=Cupriavidus metallidurans TaxID=119219 RepID=UPI0004934E68|nr:hypothetical protein [Cupriavidus metallidurans]MDE4918382.1 hypothetical protein [Cupriavidus metallidurans]
MELDLDHIERIAKQRQEAGGRLAARPEVILAMAARIRALESASQPGIGEADTARLDWLQTNGCTVRRADNGKRNLVIWSNGSIREAIDAARASLDGRREG